MLLELPHDSSTLKGSVYFAIRGKKELQNSLRLFLVLAIVLPLIYYFASVWKIDTTSLTCECSCILCSNFENLCPNNAYFSALGMRPHLLHPHAVRLCQRS